MCAEHVGCWAGCSARLAAVLGWLWGSAGCGARLAVVLGLLRCVAGCGARVAAVLSQTYISGQWVSIGLVDVRYQPRARPRKLVVLQYFFKEDGFHLVASLVWCRCCLQCSQGKSCLSVGLAQLAGKHGAFCHGNIVWPSTTGSGGPFQASM